MAVEKVVMVTGAGGGLGQALVTEFRKQRWRVAAGYRIEGSPASDADILPLQMDVTNSESVRSGVEKTLDHWQRVDVLVNNAGVAHDAALPQMDDEAWEQVLAVNLKGAFLCAQAVSRAMIKQRDGHIINVSSFSGRAGQRGQFLRVRDRVSRFPAGDRRVGHADGRGHLGLRDLGSSPHRAHAVSVEVTSRHLTLVFRQTEGTSAR